MVKIPLYGQDGTVRDYVLVDDADAEFVMRFRWHKDNCGYARRHETGKGRRERRAALMMHREILGLAPGRYPNVDHRNGNRLDNRRQNLRACTPAQNCMNRRKPRGGAAFKGVTKNTCGEKWQACIYHEGKRIHLGSFDTPEQAAAAYDKESSRLRGEFAVTNSELGLLKG